MFTEPVGLRLVVMLAELGDGITLALVENPIPGVWDHHRETAAESMLHAYDHHKSPDM
jgi:hypothetical protein